jgi:probable addiction module antidote protein
MKKVKLKTTKWDVVDYLKTDEDMADYLEAAMEDGHPAVIATAIGNIARAKGMTEVARKAGIGRVSLYKALSQRQSGICHCTQGCECTWFASSC